MAKLQEQSADEQDKLQSEIKKLNQLVKQGDQDRLKSNDIEAELDSVKSSLVQKDNEIERLKFKLQSSSKNEVNDLAGLDSGADNSFE